MLLIKSFFRKKNTKSYLIILLLLMIILTVLNSVKEIYNEKNNSNYRGSFISLKITEKELTESKIKKDIAMIKQISVVEIDDFEIFFTDKSLSDNIKVKNKMDIIIPKEFENDTFFGEKKILNINNKDYEFIISGYYDSNRFPFMYIVSEEMLEEINKSADKYLLFTLNNWLNQEKIVRYLDDTFHPDKMYVHIKENQKLNLNELIITFNILIFLIVIAFIVIYFVTIYNIIFDEKKINKLYYYLGYSRKKLIILTLNKLVILNVIILLMYFITKSILLIVF